MLFFYVFTSFEQIVLKQLDTHMQNNEVGPLAPTIYKKKKHLKVGQRCKC